MPIWKITADGPDKIHTIDLDKEGVLEHRLEDWIFADSSLLGEPLLIIGQRLNGADQPPWMINGRKWHLEKQCSNKTRQVLLGLDALIQENFGVETSWNQKFYVAYRVGNYNWLRIGTGANQVGVDIFAKSGTFDQQELAQELGVPEFDRKKHLADKISLPSSVMVQQESKKRERVIVRIKEGFDLGNSSFMALLKKAYDCFRM